MGSEMCIRDREEGYDVTKDWIPVVPAQHYFMGGIHVDSDSRTTMDRLFAIGETSCNGVHGANRLASNSLLESLVFARRAAEKIQKQEKENRKFEETDVFDTLCQQAQEGIQIDNLTEIYKQEILQEIEKEKQAK